MNNNRVLGWDDCIIATPEQDTLLGLNNKHFGELLCGQHQQLQKCVLALKLQCT